jgi:S-adenosylmethionine:tRNA ribosyltransferase-isomerase
MSEIDQYDYELPRHLIAQTPLPHRADARMLVVDRGSRSIDHRRVRDLPEILRPGDCLVLNNTRVVPARLVGHRATTGGKWEGLFLEADPRGLWRVLSKTRGHLAEGETITLLDLEGRPGAVLHMAAREPEGVWLVRPEPNEPPLELLERVGRIPLPPYIRKGQMVDADRDTYQTVFASVPGAVAAPTAGLHFTRSLLEQMAGQGVELAWLTLHVGLGTFRPIEVSSLAEHRMHSEWGQLSPETVATIQRCRQGGGRVVAAGTTSLRLLETAARRGTLEPFSGSTDLFIRPPFQFHGVDALMTNFHLPRTTLLVLVRTFGGDALIHQAYEEAIREEYRFYSYGDAMLIL